MGEGLARTAGERQRHSLMRHDGATISLQRQGLVTSTATLKRNANAPATARDAARSGDDKAMLKAAADLTRDLNSANPAIYWTDLLLSALAGYGGLVGAMLLRPAPLAALAGLGAVLALYRARRFIPEVSHPEPPAVRGSRLMWNLVIETPLLVPSFMYEGVHNQHHAKRYYGTANDPEYLPLALMKPWTLPVFLI